MVPSRVDGTVPDTARSSMTLVAALDNTTRLDWTDLEKAGWLVLPTPLGSSVFFLSPQWFLDEWMVSLEIQT